VRFSIHLALLTTLTMTTGLQAASTPGADSAGYANSAGMASPYVPIESWTYAAIDRLAAAGYVQTAFVGLRPWTRMESARLVDEGEERYARDPANEDMAPVLASLRREFQTELANYDGKPNTSAVLDSAYVRSTSIAGRPLTDGYHFGETLQNNYGRPYGQGANVYAGLAYRVTWGHLAGYVRGEFQRAAGAPITLSNTAQQEIAAADFTPTAAAGPVSGVARGRLLDAYASVMLGGNQFTFGQQTLWWGPGMSGSSLFSNNAEPMMMLRYDRTRPWAIPGVKHVLGPIRAQLFIGRLAGAQFVHARHTTFGTSGQALHNQPFIHGEKVSFKPTENLEFSVSLTTIFAGEGAPFTTRSFVRSYFSTSNGVEEDDPGDRRSAFDVQYRVPGVRQCLTVYADTFTDDEPFPLAYPTESVWLPGFNLRCLPGSSRWNVRAEGLLSPPRDIFPGFYYFNVHYLSGYTNNRQLMGSWIGREGEGFQAWTRYWLSPRSFVEASTRSVNVNQEFLRGGTIRDFGVVADVSMRHAMRLRVEAQAERWRFPLLAAGPTHNYSLTVQLSYSGGEGAR
jgi:Capsule assembly protein Wzi